MNILQILLDKEIKAKSLSVREAAKEIGTSHTTLYRAIEGNTIDLETHIKICEWLKINPSTAIDTLSKINDPMPNKISILLEKSPKLSEILSKLVTSIEEENVEPEIMEEIFSFIVFKLSLLK